MSDAVPSQSLSEDIAFLRVLAEAGGNRPILGGSILVATGVIYAMACVADWVVMTRAPGSIQSAWIRMMWIWMGALALQVVVVAVMVARMKRRQTRPATHANRVFGKVWNGVGLAILSCLASFFLTAWLTRTPVIFAGSATVVLALYGVGWIATAATSRERWAWTVAGLCFVFAVAIGPFVFSPNLPLIFALALLLLLALPGALLLKRSQAGA